MLHLMPLMPYTVIWVRKMAKRQNSSTITLGYVRVSTLEQTKFGVSLESQEEKLRAYCQMAGLDLVAVIREEGVSASIQLSKRPGGALLLERIDAGAFHVVALKLDRLFRDAEDALRQTKAWDRAGVALHFIDMGGASISTASAMGRMMLTTMAGFAELERNLIAERTAMSLCHKRNHRQVYNHEPYGFKRVGRDLVEIATEIEVAHLIRDRRNDGWSLGMIASTLNDDMVPTKLGNRWYAQTVKNVLETSLNI